ncbi:hypothetical protein [Methylobacterium sp. SyP6R]|uniref:hypothetical protein n=1 Tax=Methylobacterium sp. SyP6R TaxID=2718876 RepID=UPI001F48C8BD|nr:hypothetical protein [Methylobacterium sp. SyP6R]MCF4125059.1 hypothetical protein [Methylobacterium sp. SyP6R]
MRLFRLIIAASTALVPAIVLAQGVVAPMPLPPGSTGQADGLTVGGTAIRTILDAKAPIKDPVFSGTATAPVFAGDASGMTATPSAAAPVGSVSRLLAPSYGLGLSTVYMPPPSGDAATDAGRFAAAQATGARIVVFQAGVYQVPPAGYATLRSNQSVVGQGSGSTILRITGQGTGDGMMRALESGDIELRGLTLDYAGNRAASLSGGILVLRNARQIRLTDVNLIGWPVVGLDVNGGSDISYRGGRNVRASTPLNVAGAVIPLGQRVQCMNASATAGLPERFLFEDVACTGAGFLADGVDFTYVRTSVVGWSFGAAYVSAQGAGTTRHRFLGVRATGGRTAASGYDADATSASCFEMWGSETVIDGARCDDAGGGGVSVGGQNSRVINSRFSRLGMQVPSDGIIAMYDSSIHNAAGSLIANNVVVSTSGDGSALKLPYTQQSLAPDLTVSLTGNDFGAIPLPRKGGGERWGSPGMLISGTSSPYTHASCSSRGPLGITVAGAMRRRDTVVGVTFTGADGSALPSGLRASAEVSADNNIVFTTVDVACSGSNTTVPAGTFTARLITIQ